MRGRDSSERERGRGEKGGTALARGKELNVKCRYGAEQCGGNPVSDEECPRVPQLAPAEPPEYAAFPLCEVAAPPLPSRPITPLYGP